MLIVTDSVDRRHHTHCGATNNIYNIKYFFFQKQRTGNVYFNKCCNSIFRKKHNYIIKSNNFDKKTIIILLINYNIFDFFYYYFYSIILGYFLSNVCDSFLGQNLLKKKMSLSYDNYVHQYFFFPFSLIQ